MLSKYNGATLVALYQFYPCLLFCTIVHKDTLKQLVSHILMPPTEKAGQWQPSAQSFLPHFKNHQPPLLCTILNCIELYSFASHLIESHRVESHCIAIGVNRIVSYRISSCFCVSLMYRIVGSV